MRTGDSAGAAVPGCTAGKCLRTDSRPITFVSLFMSSRVCTPLRVTKLQGRESLGDTLCQDDLVGNTASTITPIGPNRKPRIKPSTPERTFESTGLQVGGF